MTVTRVLLFLALSLCLHCMALSVNLRLVSETATSPQPGIGYVARSLDSFYPVVMSSSIPRKATDAAPVTAAPFEHRPVAVDVAKALISASAPVKPQIQLKSNQPAPLSVKENIVEEKADKSDVHILPEQGNLQVLSFPAPPSEVYGIESESKGSELLEVGIGKDPDSSVSASIPRSGVGMQNKSDSKLNFRQALPRYDSSPAPEYPAVAKRRGWQGKVQFEVLVLENGRVGNLEILVSSGYKSLDHAARKAIYRWKFQPASSYGVAVESRVVVPVVFKLDDN